VHGTTGRRPVEVFAQEEQAQLLLLPRQRYESVVWKQATVHADSHVHFERRLYSVPWRLINREVWIRATTTSLAIYVDDERVATHSRSGSKLRSTHEDHLPEGRAELRHRSRSYWETRADRIGSDVGVFVREYGRHVRPGESDTLGAGSPASRRVASAQRGGKHEKPRCLVPPTTAMRSKSCLRPSRRNLAKGVPALRSPLARLAPAGGQDV